MKKSKFAIFVTLFGITTFATYVVVVYLKAGNPSLEEFLFDFKDPDILMHIMMTGILIVSIITGYLMNERKKLLVKAEDSKIYLTQMLNEWRTTFDSMTYGIMLTDREFNIIKANKYLADMLGFSLKDLVKNRKCYEVIHRQVAPVDACPVVNYAGAKGTCTLEYFDENLKRYLNIRVTPVFTNGTPSGYVHSLIDITDKKQQEIKLIESKDAFFNMLKDIDSAHKELIEINNDLIVAFANAIDAKSPWTKGHSVGVADFSVAIAEELGVCGPDIEILRTAALLHDIGKIGTYDVILDKPGKLTDEEFEMVKKHPAKGVEILEPIKGLKSIRPMIRSHHERIDGKGYPDGLKGNDIPFFAKILCVADAYDSMTSDRPYRQSRGKDFAVEELKQCAGTQFDPQVVEAFLKVLQKDKSVQHN